MNDWTVTTPLRNVVSDALSCASSTAPGNEGLLLQLAAKSQNEPFEPTQFTVAAPPEPLPMRANADKTANAKGFLARQNRVRDFMTFPS